MGKKDRSLVQRIWPLPDYVVIPVAFTAILFLIAFAIAYPPWLQRWFMGKEGQGNVILAFATIALIMVTAVYAYHTHTLAQATRKLAKESEKQRVDSLRPVVLLRMGELAVSEENLDSIVLDENQNPPVLSAEVTNIGVGPALDVKVEIQGKIHSFAPLAAGQSYPANISMAIHGSSPPQALTVKLHYNDIFSNGRVTSQKLAFVGPDYAVEQTRVTDL